MAISDATFSSFFLASFAMSISGSSAHPPVALSLRQDRALGWSRRTSKPSRCGALGSNPLSRTTSSSRPGRTAESSSSTAKKSYRAEAPEPRARATHWIPGKIFWPKVPPQVMVMGLWAPPNFNGFAWSETTTRGKGARNAATCPETRSLRFPPVCTKNAQRKVVLRLATAVGILAWQDRLSVGSNISCTAALNWDPFSADRALT
mmetsp:Transcript_57892/g.131191  ORF Transcript_57892/g.131191 Transcript_57892/m.131191 type:complete len:205 (+) Transcript_57892:1053-1667(+)